MFCEVRLSVDRVRVKKLQGERRPSFGSTEAGAQALAPNCRRRYCGINIPQQSENMCVCMVPYLDSF
jgi:hypothetical protein